MTRELVPATVPLLGTRLIEASAGTGKTYAITSLYVRLLVERGLTVEQILVVTYTRAATAELRERIRGRLRCALAALEAGGDPADELLDAVAKRAIEAGQQTEVRGRVLYALRSFDQAAIFTIHGFCQRTLQNSAFESGVSFDTELITAQGHILTEIAQDFWANRMYGASRGFVEFLAGHKPAVTVDTFAAVARRVAGDPDLPVLPEAVANADVDAEVRWREAHAVAAALWREQRTEVAELLTTSDALNRNKYRIGSIETKWLPAMDRAMAPSAHAIPRDFDAFAKFSRSGLASGVKRGKTPPAHAFFDACESLLERDRELAAAMEARLAGLYLELIDYARTELRRRKEQAAVQSFDDLLHRLAAGLRGRGGPALEQAIRSRYPAALIDEFQDTDPVQYDVFRRVYHAAHDQHELSLFLIGDPKQAIYAFRGADVFAYMDARDDAGDDVLALSRNWRSDPRLIQAVNALFARVDQAFVFDGIQFRPASLSPRSTERLEGAYRAHGALRVLLVPRDGNTGRDGRITKTWANQHVPALVADDVVSMLTSDTTIEGRAVAPGDVAVLCRTNSQVSWMQDALRAVGVPSVLEGDASVFDAPSAAEVEYVLRALRHPGDPGVVRAAVATILLGGSGDDLAAMGEDEAEWDRWLGLFRAWALVWRDQGFIQAFRRVLEDRQVAGRLLALPDGERRMTNIHHLGELLQTRAVASGDGPEGLIRWLSVMRTSPDARTTAVGDTAQLKLETDADAVKLVTIHKSKGLEYPVVYCPFLWDGTLLHKSDGEWVRFHDSDDGNRLKLDFGSARHAEHRLAAEREALAENLRLLYVALTRAKHMCSVVWGGFSDMGRSALAYLLHQPGGVGTDSAGLEAIAQHAAGLSDDELREALAEFASAAPGAISVQPVAGVVGAVMPPRPGHGGRLAARLARRILSSAPRSTSFSSLVAGEHRAAGPGEQPEDAPILAGAVDAVAADTGEPVPLAEVPRGTRAGQMMHAVLEYIDFQSTADESHAVIRQQVARFGFEDTWAAPLAAGIADALAAPLVPASFSLTAIERAARLDELEFTFSTDGRGGGLTPTRLAALLEARDEPPWTKDYPGAVKALSFSALDGYLHGFIDLVFCHDDRWYLVDYKSNHLGDHPTDYAAPHLADAMAAHHYVVQYHVYLVALHRYLRARLPGYDYDQHFGGVFYLFLRGMAPAHPPGCGVYFDRPPRSTVDQLDAAMGGRQRSREAAR